MRAHVRAQITCKKPYKKFDTQKLGFLLKVAVLKFTPLVTQIQKLGRPPLRLKNMFRSALVHKTMLAAKGMYAQILEKIKVLKNDIGYI